MKLLLIACIIALAFAMTHENHEIKRGKKWIHKGPVNDYFFGLGFFTDANYLKITITLPKV